LPQHKNHDFEPHPLPQRNTVSQCSGNAGPTLPRIARGVRDPRGDLARVSLDTLAGLDHRTAIASFGLGQTCVGAASLRRRTMPARLRNR